MNRFPYLRPGQEIYGLLPSSELSPEHRWSAAVAELTAAAQALDSSIVSGWVVRYKLADGKPGKLRGIIFEREGDNK